MKAATMPEFDIGYYVLAAAGNQIDAIERLLSKESIIFGFKALFQHQILALKDYGFEDILPRLEINRSLEHIDNNKNIHISGLEERHVDEAVSCDQTNEPQSTTDVISQIVKKKIVTHTSVRCTREQNSVPSENIYSVSYSCMSGTDDNTDHEDQVKEIEVLSSETGSKLKRCKLGRPRKHLNNVTFAKDIEVDDSKKQDTFKSGPLNIESGNFCRLCNCSFASRRTTMKHLKRRHPNLYQAKIHSNKPGEELCVICDKFYRNKLSLKRHQYKMHREAMPMFECRVCDAKFQNKKDLTNHRQSEKHDTKTWMRRRTLCDDCGKTLQTLMSFREHKKVCQSKERKFKCDQCCMRFKSRTHLLGHKAHVHDEQALACHVCGKLCKNQGSLRNHSKRHDESNKKHICTTCCKSFFNACKLREHVRIHTKEKPYTCNICSYTCAIRTNLGKHLKQVHKLLPDAKQYQTVMQQSTNGSDNSQRSISSVPEVLNATVSVSNNTSNTVCSEQEMEHSVIHSVDAAKASTQLVTSSANSVLLYPIYSHQNHFHNSAALHPPSYSIMSTHDFNTPKISLTSL